MKKLNWICMLVLFISTLFACSNDEQVLEQENTTANSISQKKLNGKIPFTVENVNEELPIVLDYYREYRPEVAERFNNYDVKPTHIYYKFTPSDSLQYATLMEQDNVLSLTSDPFEYNIEERTDDPTDDEIP